MFPFYLTERKTRPSERGWDVHQMFLSDEKEEFIDCINEAVSMYEEEIKKAEGLRMITINSQIKIKS